MNGFLCWPFSFVLHIKVGNKILGKNFCMEHFSICLNTQHPKVEANKNWCKGNHKGLPLQMMYFTLAENARQSPPYKNPDNVCFYGASHHANSPGN